VPIVLVPGFTQSAAAWTDVVAELGADDLRVLDRVPIAETFEASAHAMGASAGAGTYVGYSMGGRLCLRLALDRPELVSRLVLVSATPGLRDDAERTARVARDEVLAGDLERDGLEAFLTRWLAQPMFASIPAGRSGIDARRRLRPEYVAACLRVLGTGAMEPMWDRLTELQMPVRVVTGAHDEKFDAIGVEMCAQIGANASHERLDGGHALLLEHPTELARLIAGFARPDHDASTKPTDSSTESTS
jgi:2-succinyl-6-hydroxy-2,4-cyclohexadiene-1-carboxylate synthase